MFGDEVEVSKPDPGGTTAKGVEGLLKAAADRMTPGTFHQSDPGDLETAEITTNKSANKFLHDTTEKVKPPDPKSISKN